MKIKPDKNCKACHGTGIVEDHVPWGMGTTAMESICDCVSEQVPEERDGEEIEIDES